MPISTKPEVVADWWYCDDEICQCSHPRIRELTPPTTTFDGYTVYARGRALEDGPMYSEPDAAERREQWQWLLDAARRHKADNLADIEREAAVYLDLTTPPS